MRKIEKAEQSFNLVELLSTLAAAAAAAEEEDEDRP